MLNQKHSYHFDADAWQVLEFCMSIGKAQGSDRVINIKYSEYNDSIVRLHLSSMAGHRAGILDVIYIGATLPRNDEQGILAGAEDVAQIIFTQNAPGTCEAHLRIEDEAAAWGNSNSHQLLHSIGPEAIVTMWHDLIKSWGARKMIIEQTEPPDPDVAGWAACFEWYYSVGQPKQRLSLKELAFKIHKDYGYTRQKASLYKHT